MDNKPQSAAECVDVLETLEDMSLNDMKGKMLISCIKVSYLYKLHFFSSFRFSKMPNNLHMLI